MASSKPNAEFLDEAKEILDRAHRRLLKRWTDIVVNPFIKKAIEEGVIPPNATTLPKTEWIGEHPHDKRDKE